MARGHAGIPSAVQFALKKSELLRLLAQVDRDVHMRNRVLQLETRLRLRVAAHLAALPGKNAPLDDLKTNPFVLMMVCSDRSIQKVSQLESLILPAKQFSSMETSAGRMIEEEVLPAYGWSVVKSGMHSGNSVLDVAKPAKTQVDLATVKSGPRCLNDEMSKDIADDIIRNAGTWAKHYGASKLRFSYAVLYGTYRQSNKKDWHILRNICQKLPSGTVTRDAAGSMGCSFSIGQVDVDVDIRIGSEWWDHVGGPTTTVEVLVALIRACVAPGASDPSGHAYQIADLGTVVDVGQVPGSYNVGLLQRSQLPWLFLLARHFCDSLV